MKCLIFFGWVGLALLAGGLVITQGLAHGGGAASAAESGNNACCDCCPHCGCRLEAVCQICCTTKKVTEYKYRCISDDKCIPGVTPICKKHATRCDECPDCSAGRCKVKEVKQLVKCPVSEDDWRGPVARANRLSPGPLNATAAITPGACWRRPGRRPCSIRRAWDIRAGPVGGRRSQPGAVPKPSPPSFLFFPDSPLAPSSAPCLLISNAFLTLAAVRFRTGIFPRGVACQRLMRPITTF
jgi:hypothetical protein